MWALVQLQVLTGARSGELVILRARDIDRSGPVWIYRPVEHKTAHHGHERTIYLGPKAQEVLNPFLLRPAEAYCFSQREAEEARRAKMHAKRKTPLSCGNSPGTNCVRRPRWAPRERYDAGSYARAILYAAKKAGVPHWHPHQLRHAAATNLRREFGIEVARVILGHQDIGVTQLYANAAPVTPPPKASLHDPIRP